MKKRKGIQGMLVIFAMLLCLGTGVRGASEDTAGSEKRERTSLTVNGSVSRTLWCTPVKTSASFQLGDVVFAEDLSKLSCSVENAAKSIASVSYDKNTGEVTITPDTFGKQNMIVKISDQRGQSALLLVEVSIYPSWLWFLAPAAAVLLLLFLFSRKKAKPVFEEPVTVELMLPPPLFYLTPASVSLMMPVGKSRVNLSRLIEMDQAAYGALAVPIEKAGLQPLLEKIQLRAEKDEGVSLKLLPGIPGMTSLERHTVRTEKGAACFLKRGGRAEIHFTPDKGFGSSTVGVTLGDAGGWSGREPESRAADDFFMP